MRPLTHRSPDLHGTGDRRCRRSASCDRLPAAWGVLPALGCTDWLVAGEGQACPGRLGPGSPSGLPAAPDAVPSRGYLALAVQSAPVVRSPAICVTATD